MHFKCHRDLAGAVLATALAALPPGPAEWREIYRRGEYRLVYGND